MRVVALVHFAAPYRMAGSETMLHTMMKALADAGHETLIVASDMPHAPERWNHEGVSGISARGLAQAVAHATAARPDIVVTHHQNATAGIQLARRVRARSVFIQHNDFPMNTQIHAVKPDLTVFNTEWMARSWSHKALSWMVVHPPVWAHEHAATPGDCVTLVNLNRHKGSEIFSRLARHFSGQHFLGVTGGHGEQVTWGHPLNVEVIGQTSDMRRDVWSRTKVLLVPSVYESYGMVAAEAVASGIPVMATPTPGLQEALGGGGVFIERDALAMWVARLKELLESPEAWRAASERALERSRQLNPARELGEWVRVVSELHSGSLAAA